MGLQRDSHYSWFLDDKCIYTHDLHSYFAMFYILVICALPNVMRTMNIQFFLH